MELPGQSINLEERVRQHKKYGGAKTSLLKYSMFNHSRQNHKYFLVMELDEFADQAILKEWEKFYIKKFTDEGHKLLNGNSGGAGGNKGGYGSKNRKQQIQSAVITYIRGLLVSFIGKLYLSDKTYSLYEILISLFDILNIFIMLKR